MFLDFAVNFLIFPIITQSVDLTRSYDAERRVEVHSAPVLRLRHLSPDGPTDRSNDVHLANYWEKVSRCLLSSSDRVARAGLDDLRDNADLQPLLPSATRFLQDLVRHGKEESRVARRIPMILAALVDNRHFNIDPEVRWRDMNIHNNTVWCAEVAVLSSNRSIRATENQVK